MKIEFTTGTMRQGDRHALLIGCFEDGIEELQVADYERLFHDALQSVYDSGEFTGKFRTLKLLHSFGSPYTQQILLVGLGKKKELSKERLRQASGTAIQSLNTSRLLAFSSALHRASRNLEEGLAATLEGFILGNYSFTNYMTKTGDKTVVEKCIVLLERDTDLKTAERTLIETRAVTDGVILARDLVSHPGNVATPQFIGERAMAESARCDFDCRILDREEMERNGMEGILSVARGSHQQPKFIVLEYFKGGTTKRPIVLAGKGVTFDSGGISLKPRDGMEKMKNDMAGGAAVLGTLVAVAKLGLPLNLVGLIPAAENLPGGGAYKPGDVVRTMSGQTIEIVNTDAEGRMLLCDTITYALRYKPSALIDIATLTGACVVALGTVASGLMGNDDKLKRNLKAAGERTGERLWELPVWEEYGELMKSDIADMKNAGGPTAGTISAAWFLKSFVGNVKWAHLDIAGTAWEEKGAGYVPKGATGVGVRLLVDYLRLQLKSGNK